MSKRRSPLFSHAGRRGFLTRAVGLGLAGAAGADAWGAVERMVELPFGNGRRAVATDFPQKGALILQRTRPPLLETPFEVFDRHLFTPNDAFYVRWHMANIPTRIDPATFRLAVRGHVERPLTLTLDTLVRDFEPVEVAAVNQCSGNSRGYYAPRVPGAQWAHGAMGNARWTGVRLKDVLERAGVRAGAQRVRMNGLETPIMPDTPAFKKSLAIDHALDGEAVIAYLIEVLDRPDDNYWTARAYLIPDTPGANVQPGQTGVRMIPINRMVPRSFITNPPDGARLARGASAEVRGIAFGRDCGVAGVRVSPDGGRTWLDALLDRDYGRYSFRRWRLVFTPPATGPLVLMVRATNTAGVAQPLQSNWNGSGFMRNGVESVALHVI